LIDESSVRRQGRRRAFGATFMMPRPEEMTGKLGKAGIAPHMIAKERLMTQPCAEQRIKDIPVESLRQGLSAADGKRASRRPDRAW
jgi:hypothetical protein